MELFFKTCYNRYGGYMQYYQRGKIVKATVTKIMEYGFFVELIDDYKGLVHVSEISDRFVSNIHNYVEVGENISVQILDVDVQFKKLQLSIKNISYKRKKQRVRIIETKKGFDTLRRCLPYWIEEGLKEEKYLKLY